MSLRLKFGPTSLIPLLQLLIPHQILLIHLLFLFHLFFVEDALLDGLEGDFEAVFDPPGFHFLNEEDELVNFRLILKDLFHVLCHVEYFIEADRQSVLQKHSRQTFETPYPH